MKTYGGVDAPRINPRFLDVGASYEWSALPLDLFTPGKRVPGTH
jgi:hypothetical protein